MKTNKTVEWIAVFTESDVSAWTRSGGSVRTVPRPASGGLKAAWEAAQPLFSAPRGAAGIVLSTDFFAQSIRLPDRQTQGLAEDDLRRVLAFEAEPFSQISPDAGLLAFAPGAAGADGSRTWEVMQVARQDAEALEGAARAARLRLAGLGVPPRTFDPAVADAPDLLKTLADGTASQPLVSPATTTRGGDAGRLRSALLAAALVACLATYGVQESMLSKARAELSRREISAQGVAGLQRQLQDIQGRIAEVERARAEAADAAGRLVAYRAAWGGLLRSLSEAGGGMVVQRLAATGPFAADIRAFCADEAEPARAMAAIAPSAGPLGWQVHPGPIESSADGGIVRFSFSAELDPAAATAQGGGEP